MKTSIVLYAIGIIVLFAGVAMYALPWHRTIGLGGLVLGILVLAAGAFTTTKERKPSVVQPKQSERTSA